MTEDYVALSEQLDLDGLDWYCKPDECRESFVAGDAEDFVSGLGNDGFYIVTNPANIDILKARGIYEASLLEAYSSVKHNLSNWESDVIEFVFRAGEWDDYLCEIPELQNSGTMTVYRGVAGEGDSRRENGVSWTTDLDTAMSFAIKFSRPGHGALADPQVLVAEINMDDSVFAAYDGRGEDEILAWLDDYKPMNLTRDEMLAGWDRRCEQVRRQNEQSMDRMRAEMATA